MQLLFQDIIWNAINIGMEASECVAKVTKRKEALSTTSRGIVVYQF